LVIQARSLALSAGSTNPADVLATLAPTVRGYLQTFDTALNADFEGRYIFGGQNTTSSPVQAAVVAAPMPAAGPDTTYYQGDTEKMKTITSANTTFEYGVTANDPTFAQIRAGLQALWYGLQNNDKVEIENATAQLQQAQAGLSGLFGEVGGAMAGLDIIQTRHDNNADFLKEQITNLDSVDVTEAISKFTQEQSAFQASLLVMSKLNSVSLADYI
jgi:flagellar hook-associated protein 3 FlgL